MTERIFREIVVYSMDKLSEANVGYQFSFDLPDGRNDGILRLQRGYKPEGKICFSTGAVAKGDDHLVQHFLHYAADMDEMRGWLQNAANADAVIKSLLELGARVDEGFD